VLTAVLDYVSVAGATVFISSHLVHELERICDWVGVLDEGCPSSPSSPCRASRTTRSTRWRLT